MMLWFCEGLLSWSEPMVVTVRGSEKVASLTSSRRFVAVVNIKMIKRVFAEVQIHVAKI